MNDWLVLMAVGLASMRITETLKEIIPWPPQPWTKGAISMALGIAGCFLAGVQAWDAVVLGLGSAGFSALVHEIRDSLSTRSDIYKVEVMRAGMRKR